MRHTPTHTPGTALVDKVQWGWLGNIEGPMTLALLFGKIRVAADGDWEALGHCHSIKTTTQHQVEFVP